MKFFLPVRKRLFTLLRPLSSILLTAAFTITLSGCYLLPEDEEVLAPPVVLEEPVAQRITTEKVRRGDIIKKIKFWGTFMSPVQEDLFFTYMGRLKSLDVEYGDRVQAGEVMARLESEDLDSQLAQLEISLKKAKLYYNRLETENKISDGGLEYELLDARLSMDSIELGIAGIQNNISKVSVISPINGIVAYVNPTEPGQMITVRKTFITVCDPNEMVLVVKENSVKEKLPIGKEVSVDYNGKSYKGKVIKTPEENINEENPNFKSAYTLSVEGLDMSQVNLNDTASVEYVIQQSNNVLIIDKSFIRAEGGKKFVNVYKDGAIEEREVETGLESDNGVDMEITKGLAETDEILVQ